MWVIDIFMLLVSCVLFLVTATLGLQVLASLLPERGDKPPSNEDPSFVVIMPAHNEESIIEQSVRRLIGQLGSSGRLLVVADNCNDDTAQRARAGGARVVERSDPERRGKGYALAYGVDSLASDPPEVIVILDADCRVAHDETLKLLASAACQHQCPVQGRNDMLALAGSSLKQRFAAFAWAFKGRVRTSGFRRLGLPCNLQGTGMALPWSLLGQIDLATGHITEDLKIGLDCALVGSFPMYFPAAVVESDFPSNEEGTHSQRQRWEHGHLSILISEIPRSITTAVKDHNWRLLAMCADVCIPPLSLLGLVLAANATLALPLYFWHWTSLIVVLLAMVSILLFSVAVLIGWWKVGRQWVSPTELIMIPFYIAAKIPIYVGFFLRKRVSWIRTKRD